jgi:hypothetical protein
VFTILDYQGISSANETIFIAFNVLGLVLFEYAVPEGVTATTVVDLPHGYIQGKCVLQPAGSG